MEEWWCPKPWTVEIIEQDWRAGGRSAMVIARAERRGDAAGRCVPRGVARQPLRLHRRIHHRLEPATTVHGWCDGISPTRTEKTRYTASARHWTRESYDQHKAMGFEQGWAAVAEQLAALAEAETKSTGPLKFHPRQQFSFSAACAAAKPPCVMAGLGPHGHPE